MEKQKHSRVSAGRDEEAAGESAEAPSSADRPFVVSEADAGGDHQADAALVADYEQSARHKTNLRAATPGSDEDQDYRQLVEVAGIAIVVASRGKAVFANATAARLFGYRAADDILALERVDHLVCQTQRKRLNRVARDLLRNPSGHISYEATGVRADGTFVNLRVVLNSIGWEGASAICATLIDLTEREEAQTLAITRLAELAHFERVCSLGEMSAAIMHEVAQPLTALSLAAGACNRLLTRSKPNLAHAAQAASTMESQAKRMRETIDRIRQFAGGGAIRTQEHSEVLDVVMAVNQAFLLTAPTFRQAGVVRRMHLRCGADARQVFADPVQLSQVLVNLLLNAIDALVADGRTDGKVTVKIARARGRVIMEVADNGPGIPPERAEQIFAPFFSTKEKGMGIGLSVCRSIVESFGGALEVLTPIRSGATFRVSLPPHGGSDG